MSKEKLAALEETNNYVFHGSPDGNITELEPRQGTHIPDISKPEKFIPDGDPAVSATPYSEFAIYRAIVNGENIPIDHTSGFGLFGDGTKEFRISSEEALKQTEGKKGFVYVFDKDKFKPWDRKGDSARVNTMEWRAHEPVKPVEVVEVTHHDLPPKEQIKITKNK